ncbi:MAG: MerR family transcriptional regulator [Melioribacteraceae bacterium]|nr:MerR family transcriptional regulator [Melioribacteraceae bacterium]MCF8356487.1 MerR family transcriptional regulator [Melioribacteraceae bacterium]MCF8394860.1 MerR family transcriptional regulator [Melioribacteraceae bacterium]MCF8420588.1 MerR family transcriptional regulator [Melioribacteraceae bacterium]
MKYSIGEFSRITSLTVKSLRLYHEKGILIPAEVDEFTNYRYYNHLNYERAKTIKILKSYDFSLLEIKEVLDECSDEADILLQLKHKLEEVNEKIDRYKNISNSLESIIQKEKESKMKNDVSFEIEEKVVDTLLIAGYRMKGKYSEAGKGFSLIAKKFGRQINGKPLSIYYDGEYKEDDADFETCLPVRKGKNVDDISVRELRGGRCISLIHKGPYDYLSETYKKLFEYVKEKNIKVMFPSREIYIKGPGIIFKGNPANYLTEVQLFVEEE